MPRAEVAAELSGRLPRRDTDPKDQFFIWKVVRRSQQITCVQLCVRTRLSAPPTSHGFRPALFGAELTPLSRHLLLASSNMSCSWAGGFTLHVAWACIRVRGGQMRRGEGHHSLNSSPQGVLSCSNLMRVTTMNEAVPHTRYER